MAATEDLSRLSNRQLKKEISRQGKIFSELNAIEPSTQELRAGKGEELLTHMDAARQSHDAASKELYRREHDRNEKEWVQYRRADRAMREQAAEREAEKRKTAAARKALQMVLPPPGASAERLTQAEGEELLALVQWSRKESLTAAEQARWEDLLAKSAGDPGYYERQRQAAAIAEKEKALAERARLDSMPARTFTGKGGAYLPGFLWQWSTDPREGGMGVIETGVLGTLLMAFENSEPLFRGSRFEDGAMVLDAASPFQLSRPFIEEGDLGAIRTRQAVAFLVRNDWLQLSDDGLRLTLGQRARDLYAEGGESNGN